MYKYQKVCINRWLNPYTVWPHAPLGSIGMYNYQKVCINGAPHHNQ